MRQIFGQTKGNFLTFKEINHFMLKKVYGSAVFGVEASTITVEVNIDEFNWFILRDMHKQLFKSILK